MRLRPIASLGCRNRHVRQRDHHDQLSGLAITGARGVIGRVLLEALAERRPRSLDLPDTDLRDPDAAVEGIRGCEQVVHLAWDTRTENFGRATFSADNAQITFNVLSACLHAGVRRLVFASSVHAQRYWPAYCSPLELAGGVLAGANERAAVPDGPYGASKLFGEALCRWAAGEGLECVCIRFGGVNREDAPPQDAVEQRVWLSHRDCADVVERALDAVLPDAYALVSAVSDNDGRLHSLENALGWTPLERPRRARLT